MTPDQSRERRDYLRRAADAEAFQLMQETRTMVKEIEQVMEAKFDALSSEINAHRIKAEQLHAETSRRFEHVSASTVNALSEQSKLIRALTETINKAFPDGDPEKHRLAHEEWIEKDKKDEEFWLDVKKKAVGSVVTAVVLWIGIVLWTAFVQGPK